MLHVYIRSDYFERAIKMSKNDTLINRCTSMF